MFLKHRQYNIESSMEKPSVATEVVKLWNSSRSGLRDQVRATRVKATHRCLVKSLGEGIRQYVFHTTDLSETGLYIIGDKSKYEFSVSSMLEVILYTPEGKRICFLTKIVRGNKGNEFGLKIIQSDRSESEKLHKLICALILNQVA